MYCVVEGTANVLIPYHMENVITIPQSATVEIQDKKFVYVPATGQHSKIYKKSKSLIWITEKTTWLLPV